MRIFKRTPSETEYSASVGSSPGERKAKRRFHTTLPYTLLALATALSMVKLGFWQLDRARQKERLQEDYRARQQLPTLVTDRAPSDPRTGRRLELRGSWLAAPQLLLDNQTRGRRPGYYVYSAFQAARGAAWILVNRGWIEAGPRREQAPEVGLHGGAAVLRGTLVKPTVTGLRLDNALRTEQLAPGLHRVQHLEPTVLERIFGSTPIPLELLLDPDQEQGYLRTWKAPVSRRGPEINRGYAFQWFCMAATVLIIYLVLGFRAATRRRGDAT